MRTLILGAGFGGITVASELRRHLQDGHEVVLVDEADSFLMGLRKLWALVGHGTLEEGSRPRESLNARGIRFLRRRVSGIDPAKRRVDTDGGSLDGDFLVVALGATPKPELVPGLSEHAFNLYDRDAIPGLAQELDRFSGGRIVIAIAGAPYKCPPAPYECAMLLHEFLQERGRRDRVELVVTTLQPMLLPNAGKAGSTWLGEQLSARGIEYRVGHKVERVEPGRLVFADSEVEADLLIGVAPHRAPAVVKESGLTGDGEWITVDRGTLATRYEGVFAVGDVTQIKLANGLPLPKAGLMAELEGERVAAGIAAQVRGETAPPPFDGRGFCFLETGKTAAARIEGDFFAEPEPAVAIQDVAEVHKEEKRRFESERLERWFGTPV